MGNYSLHLKRAFYIKNILKIYGKKILSHKKEMEENPFNFVVLFHKIWDADVNKLISWHTFSVR